MNGKKINRGEIWEESQGQSKGELTRIANSTLNLVNPKETARQLSLKFDEDSGIYTLDNRPVNIELTYDEIQLVYAFTLFLWDTVNNLENKEEIIRDINNNIRKSEYNRINTLITEVNLGDLARNFYGIDEKKKVEFWQRRDLMKKINEFKNKEILSYTQGDGVLNKTKDFIILVKRDRERFKIDEEGNEILDKNGRPISLGRILTIEFNDLLFYKLLQEYSEVPRNYPKLRAKYRKNNKVFPIIEGKLIKVIGVRISQLRDIPTYRREYINRYEKENARKPNTEEIERYTRNKREEILTFSINYSTIYDDYILDNSYMDKGSKYKRKARLLKDIEDSSESFKAMGLITGYKVGKSSDGGIKYIFRLNENFKNQDTIPIDK